MLIAEPKPVEQLTLRPGAETLPQPPMVEVIPGVVLVPYTSVPYNAGLDTLHKPPRDHTTLRLLKYRLEEAGVDCTMATYCAEPRTLDAQRSPDRQTFALFVLDGVGEPYETVLAQLTQEQGPYRGLFIESIPAERLHPWVFRNDPARLGRSGQLVDRGASPDPQLLQRSPDVSELKTLLEGFKDNLTPQQNGDWEGLKAELQEAKAWLAILRSPDAPGRTNVHDIDNQRAEIQRINLAITGVLAETLPAHDQAYARRLQRVSRFLNLADVVIDTRAMDTPQTRIDHWAVINRDYPPEQYPHLTRALRATLADLRHEGHAARTLLDLLYDTEGVQNTLRQNTIRAKIAEVETRCRALIDPSSVTEPIAASAAPAPEQVPDAVGDRPSRAVFLTLIDRVRQRIAAGLSAAKSNG